MSTLTITEPAAVPRKKSAFWRGLALALAAWFGGVGLSSVFVDPAEVVVFGPQHATIAATESAGASLLTAGPGFITVWSSTPGSVRALYRGGAWFVWPVFHTGCLG